MMYVSLCYNARGVYGYRKTIKMCSVDRKTCVASEDTYRFDKNTIVATQTM